MSNLNEKDAVALPVESDGKEKVSKEPVKRTAKQVIEDAKRVLSEEDERIKSEVELCVTRAGDSDLGLVGVATARLGELLRTAGSTVASVPKPLKYVRPSYATLKGHAEAVAKKNPEVGRALYDVVSFIAMTIDPAADAAKAKAEAAKAAEQAKKDGAANPDAAAAPATPAAAPAASPSTADKDGDAAKKAGETAAPEEKQPIGECLAMKILGNPNEIASWGYEYVRHLSGEAVTAHKYVSDMGVASPTTSAGMATPAYPPPPIATLDAMLSTSVKYMMEHQDEPTACDIAVEIDNFEMLESLVDAQSVLRVCPYLVATAAYLPGESDDTLLAAFRLYVRFAQLPPAMKIALQMNKADLVAQVFAAVPAGQEVVAKQLALMCGRARFFNHETGDDTLDELINNTHVSAWFRKVATDLDSLAPKTTEDIFKEHIMEKHMVPQTANSHLHNLATSFVSGFANAGFGTDVLLTGGESGAFVYQTKEHRMMSAVGCIGLLHMWDADEGLNAVNKYAFAEDNNVKAGSLLATGIVMSGVKSPFDPAFAVLQEHIVDGATREMRIAAINGLGLAYAGTAREDVKDSLLPVLVDGSQPVELQCLAAHALGLVYAGTANADVSEAVMLALMEKTPEQLQEAPIRYLVLALGLLFLRTQDGADSVLEAVKTLPDAISNYTRIVVTSCAHAATGNVVVVQRLLADIADIPESDDENEDDEPAAAAPAAGAGAGEGAEGAAAGADGAAAAPKEDKKKEKEAPTWSHKAAAILGVGLVALGEDIGSSLAKRVMNHLLLSKESPAISGRRGLPLAIAVLHVSDPQVAAMEALSKMSHDGDMPTAHAAIIGLGLISAGTNNARVAAMLRSLSGYYSKDLETLYVVRLAQGLCALGKGMLTLAPVQLDRTVVSNAALAGLLTLLHSGLSTEKTLLDKYHFMAFSVVTAVSPRMLHTVDAALEPVATQVRVGTAVDTVAMSGRPKTITGFQTHAAPVLLQHGERAELVPGKVAVAVPGTTLEGVVIVQTAKVVDEDAATA